jgi:hypothetical protein
VREFVKRELERVKTEETPPVEAVAMERLVKHGSLEKGLAGAVVICELWRLVVAL